MRRSERHAPPCSVAGTYSTVDELAGMSPARYVTPDPDDDGYDEDVPADPPPPAADDDAAPDDEPVVGDADGGGGGGSMGKARRWAKNLPDPSCCPALPLLLLALIGTVAFAFSRPPAALLQCGQATPLTLLLAPRPEAQSRTGAAARGSEEVARTQRARRGRARVVEQERRPHVRARALVCGTTLVACRARTCASDLGSDTVLWRNAKNGRVPNTPSTPVPFASLICQDKTGTEPALEGATSLSRLRLISFDYAALTPPPHTR